MAIRAHSICITIDPPLVRENTDGSTFTLEGNYVAIPELYVATTGGYDLYEADEDWTAKKPQVATVVLVLKGDGTVDIG